MRLLTYIRVSTIKQAESGLGLTAQENAALAAAKRHGGEWAEDYFGPILRPGFFTDAGESAFKIPFARRPAGKALLASLQKDDVLLVLRLDRLCRSMQDFCWLVAELERKGVTLVSPAVNMGTANGRALAKMLMVVAEWESDIKSERIKGALAVKKLSEQMAQMASKEKLVSLPSGYLPSRTSGFPLRTSGSAEPEVPEVAGRLFVYARCSHRTSAESGLGIREQLSKCDSFAAGLIEQNSSLSLTEPYIDMAVSALKTPLAKRPMGKVMCSQLSAGDHVIFYRPDRVFGSVRDMINTVHDWTERGITAHFAEDGTNTGNVTGRMMVTIMTIFSQMERELAASRNTEAKLVLEQAGKFRGGGCPVLWRMYKTETHKCLVPDRLAIIHYRYLRRLVKGEKLTIRAACERLELILAKRQNRPPLPMVGVLKNHPKFCRFKSSGRMKGDTLFPLWTPDKYKQIDDNKYVAALNEWRRLKQETKTVLTEVSIKPPKGERPT